MEPEDNELVGRCQAGDLGAFNAIVERYQSRVFNLAARILGNRTSAEDITQETFISAYRAINRFRAGSLQAWLLRIATNACRDFMRAGRQRPSESLDEHMLNPGFQVASSDPSPEQQVLQGELAAEIQQSILSIPEDQRAVLVLVDVQGMSYEEAAVAIRASIGTVKSRLSRARARVRDDLARRRELLPQEFR